MREMDTVLGGWAQCVGDGLSVRELEKELGSVCRSWAQFEGAGLSVRKLHTV